MNLTQAISDRMRAGTLVIAVEEPDELLAREAAVAAAQQFQPVRRISAADPDAVQVIENHRAAEGTLIVSDFLRVFGGNPVAVRLVREIALQQRQSGSFSRLIMLEAPGAEVPQVLAGDVELIRPSLPTVDELRQELDQFLSDRKATTQGNGEFKHSLAQAGAGLARHEYSRLLARCWIDQGKKLDAEWLGKAKAERVADKLGGALTFVPTDGIPEIGGYDPLKAWLDDRQAAFGSEKARKFGLPEPKGLLLVGVPGGGKSLTPKVVAKRWRIPLIRLDAGRLFGSLMGQSEAQTRQAIEAAEACSPCVLHIDEIEKAMAGSKSGGSSDGGTGMRVLGTILTWLQEKTKPVFVVATANRIADLPPELLRKGRFDETFFVDLPNVQERSEILAIHLGKRGRSEKLATKALAQASDGFAGAELEQVVVDAMFGAFSKGRDITEADLLAALKSTTPLSKMMVEEIRALRDWAKARARLANSAEAVIAPSVRRAAVVGE